MTEDTKYTITGKSIANLDVSSTNSRFKDNQLKLEHVSQFTDSDVLSVSVGFRGGFRSAGSMSLEVENDAINITNFRFKTSPRSIGLPRYMLGVVYGIALWADVNQVLGLVEYSRLTEEALVNAGFPKENIIVAGETKSMYFKANLEQIDFNEKNFLVIKGDK